MPRKRIYLPYAVYHITMNPKYRLPQLGEDVFCYVLSRVIIEGQSRKDYRLIGYKINPDHVHLLVQCRVRFNISEVIHHIKRNSSILINMLRTKDTESERTYFTWTPDLARLHQQLTVKYGSMLQYPHPLFYWQPGFHDVIIRSKTQLDRAIHYLKRQMEIHQLDDNHYIYIADAIPTDIHYPGK